MDDLKSSHNDKLSLSIARLREKLTLEWLRVRAANGQTSDLKKTDFRRPKSAKGL